MASRALDDLETSTRGKVDRLLAACAADSIDLLVYCTFRSFDEQAALWLQGRSIQPDGKTVKTGVTVTNAKVGESFHNVRRAIDTVPLVGGKAVWRDEHLWRRVGALGEAVGLTWGGKFGATIEAGELVKLGWDPGHFENRVAHDGAIYADAKAFAEDGTMRNLA